MTSYDVIVVGAGYIGCSAAYYLAQSGLRTLLIDKGGIGAGASRANYGNIQVQDAELEHSLPMVLAGKRYCETLEAELDLNLDLRQLGSLLIAEKESHIPALQHRASQLIPFGIHVEWLNQSQLAELEPHLDVTQTYGALYSPDEMQLSPFKLLNGYAQRAREAECSLLLDTPVTGFIVRNGRVDGIHTPAGPIYAATTILATGAWTPALGKQLGLQIPVWHVHGQAAVTSPVGNLLHNYLSSAAFFEDAHGEEAQKLQAVLAIAPTAHGNLLLGEAAAVVAHFGTHADPQAIAALRQLAVRFLPDLRAASILRAWAAPAAFTPDGRPFLGPVPGREGILLAAAFKSTVVITPLIGRVLTDLVWQREPEIDIAPFLLKRTENKPA
jgi:glycine/D-amino acid oxidase-like deaminating enzyme